MPDFNINNGVLLSCENAGPVVTIPDGVVTIGSRAFENNESIERVIVPNSVRIIAQSAFSYCKKLREIEISPSVIFIGDWAFSGCELLESVTVPDSVVYLGEEAFFDCTSLVSIKLPQYLEVLEHGVLCGCEKLPAVEIPRTVRVIGENAFTRCKSFVSVEIPFGVEVIGDGAFTMCDSLRYVYISDSVRVVEGMAFYLCNNLEHVRVPSTVMQFGYKAFPDTTPSSMRRYGFIEMCEPDDSALLPDPVLYSDIAAASYSGFEVDEHGVLQRYAGDERCIIMPSCIHAIANDAFYGNSAIESVTIPKSVEYIGNGAFSHCENLRTVRFECDQPIMGRDVFNGCSSLEDVVLPNRLNEIPQSSFWGCASLRTVNLPENLYKIGEYAFYGCTNLESVTFPEALLCIGNDAFLNCSSLVSVDLPGSLCTLGYRPFNECPELKRVSVPSRTFIPEGERLNPFSESACVSFYESGWLPEKPETKPLPIPKSQEAFREQYQQQSAKLGSPDLNVSPYAQLMKTIAFIAQAASSAGNLTQSYGIAELEAVVSDIEYNMDATGQALFALLIEHGLPFLRPGTFQRLLSEDEVPFSYREYKRSFAEDAFIPRNSQLGSAIELLNNHLDNAFQEAVKAYQYALANDQASIPVFKGGNRFGNGIIYNIAFTKSHFGSIVGSLASSNYIVLLPSDGAQFHDASAFALSEMEFNEVCKCMMPGDIDMLMKIDNSDGHITEHMHLGIGSADHIAINFGSKELDDYFDKSIRNWLEGAY